MCWRRILIPMLAAFFPATSAAQEKPKVTEKHFGTKACLECHKKESDDFANLEKLSHGKLSDGKDAFTSRLVEFQIWSTHDKHMGAAKVLKNSRSIQIAEILGFQTKDDLTKEIRCASCHGVYIDPVREVDLVDEVSFTGPDRLESGVSCVVCHGPDLRWVKEHAIVPVPPWATHSRETKEKEYGLRDLWNPVKRAELCFSCHIGNIEQNKFVTHEMYAAGHPPLPGIEIAAFSEAMPAHWESLTQKAARARERGPGAKNGPEFLKRAYGVDVAAMDMEQTRFVTITSLVAMRDSIQMMEQYAAKSIAAKSPENAWPELAFYDCYACHHDLKSKSWRLERGYSGKPGRPTVRPWPTALAVVADRLIDGEPSPLDKALPTWKGLFQEVPFGDAGEVRAEAANLVALLNRQIKTAEGKTFDRAAAERASQLILQAAKTNAHDFDSARQYAWALRTIAIELQNAGGYGLVKPGENRLKAPLAAPFGDLEESLQLRLPKGRVEIVPTMLDNVLGRISAHEPAEFRKAMAAVEEAMRKGK